MSTTTDSRKVVYSQKIPKSVLSRVIPGRRLRLREDAYKPLKEREWIFNKMEGEQIHLLHESMAYGLIVRMDDIDWSGFFEKMPEGSLLKQKGKENRSVARSYKDRSFCVRGNADN